MNRSAVKLTVGGAAFALLASTLVSNSFAQIPVVQPATEFAQPPTESYSEPSPEDLLREYDEPSKVIHLTVIVHDKALLSINGEPTYTKGTVRHYIARRVQPGKTYTFNIEALVKNEYGAEFTAAESVSIDAGSSKQVVLKVHRSKRQPVPTQPVVPSQAAPTTPPQQAPSR